MTVQELIDELMKIKDKSRKVVIDCVMEVQRVEDYEEDVEIRY